VGMVLNVTGLNETRAKALSEAATALEVRLEDSGTPIRFDKEGKGIRIRFDGMAGRVSYGEDHQFVRALGLFVEKAKTGEAFDIEETPVYDSLGMMADCSRNAVLNIDGYKELIRRLALMGYSELQLYTEDTYEIEGYPYFGYMRGRYSGEELRGMDQYASLFGIELVPCIQTLAHLGMTLKWQALAPLLDCQDILLIDEPKTYELIDRMFAAMSGCLSSRKINIGMDEAHMMGLGKYLDKHGYQDRSSLMLKHFGKVMEIARKYGYRPMMWSDMFFRLASSGEYYDADSPIRQDVAEMIPDDVTLVYPSLQLWAELCYANTSDEERLRERFKTCVGGVYDDFMDLDAPGLPPGNEAPGRNSVNPPKYLLYQDVLCGLFDRHVLSGAYSEQYRLCAEKMGQAGLRNPSWYSMFTVQQELSRVLEMKSEAGLAIRGAYSAGDRKTLSRYAHESLPELKKRTEQFADAYREQWCRENKIFGLDVFDLRIGGLLQRLDSAVRRLEQYLSGRITAWRNWRKRFCRSTACLKKAKAGLSAQTCGIRSRRLPLSREFKRKRSM